jgi:hypothetical protein
MVDENHSLRIGGPGQRVQSRFINSFPLGYQVSTFVQSPEPLGDIGDS